MPRFIFLFTLVLLVATQSRAQSGCPDPRATNYAPGARGNDGSCQYATTTTAVVTKTPLAAAVPESSGLQFTSQGLWTFNDSGNGPVLFKVDSTSGNVLQQVTITNFPNVDWEDIAADAQNLYVGDFGNNDGNRRDLKVLKVLKSAIGTSPTESVTAQAINFSYPDQTNFSPGTNNHNFDCEAFFYSNDSLHLFTKNWVDLRTKYYTVPAQPGTYVAYFKGSFNVNGLITAADLNAAGTGAGLLGYNSSTGATFLWLLSDFRGGQFLGGNKRRIELPSALFIGQAEGLTFVDQYRVFISNERIVNLITVPQRLYALNTRPWLAPAGPTAARPVAPAGISVAPNPTHQTVRVARTAPTAGPLALTLVDMQGRTILATQMPAGSAAQALDVSQVAAGLYLLRVESANGIFSHKIDIR
ncbi:T9SS type A sorting domain-containing protein [Hymenobacter properus]|uniref:T9SS type A sorting domain-containing protein n=1 Tax=Hymenobacter properus TaxID=2791026 RepID=A0A931BML8_9BACT|nr:T9SS type A sorting domain-containing protein [Hymenobacter properus]MBF9144101.1 T9SS type A sorting domain-containing protein [Hymenobacter properus]MBR7722917.1 T9SS type A sorting domain-containing protein [Microvirga sp. SRT04]